MDRVSDNAILEKVISVWSVMKSQMIFAIDTWLLNGSETMDSHAPSG